MIRYTQRLAAVLAQRYQSYPLSIATPMRMSSDRRVPISICVRWFHVREWCYRGASSFRELPVCGGFGQAWGMTAPCTTSSRAMHLLCAIRVDRPILGKYLCVSLPRVLHSLVQRNAEGSASRCPRSSLSRPPVSSPREAVRFRTRECTLPPLAAARRSPLRRSCQVHCGQR